MHFCGILSHFQMYIGFKRGKDKVTHLNDGEKNAITPYKLYWYCFVNPCYPFVKKSNLLINFLKNPDTEKMSNDDFFRQFRTPWFTLAKGRDINVNTDVYILYSTNIPELLFPVMCCVFWYLNSQKKYFNITNTEKMSNDVILTTASHYVNTCH